MKKTIVLTVFFTLVVILSLNSCGNALHNGTEMNISKVSLIGLPTNPYQEGQIMVLSYNNGTNWVHDAGREDDFKSDYFRGTVTADGSLTFTFNPPLEITTPTFTFFLIDPDTQWDSFQIDTKHSGGKGGDAILENKWSGSLTLQEIEGVVNGEEITWSYKE